MLEPNSQFTHPQDDPLDSNDPQGSDKRTVIRLRGKDQQQANAKIPAPLVTRRVSIINVCNMRTFCRLTKETKRVPIRTTLVTSFLYQMFFLPIRRLFNTHFEKQLPGLFELFRSLNM